MKVIKKKKRRVVRTKCDMCVLIPCHHI